MPTNNDGEFRGATRAQIEFLRDQLRDVRIDLKEIAKVLDQLKDFKTKVLAYAGLGAGAVTFGIHLLTTHLGG